MIENPVGRLSTYWQKPTYKFDPYEYGGYISSTTDPYTKKTCLWTSDTFVMSPKKPVIPTLGSMIKTHLGGRQKNERPITPKGFAEAVFQANK